MPMPKDAKTAPASITLMIVVTGYQNQPLHPSGADLPLNLCSPPHATTAYASHGIILHPLMAHSPAANMNISAVSVQKSIATDLAHKTTYCAH